MDKPFVIELGGAGGWGGVNQSKDPRRSDPRTLAFADRVNLLEGDLRGYLLPGRSSGAVGGSTGIVVVPDTGGGTIVNSDNQMSQCLGPVNPASTGDGRFSWHAIRPGTGASPGNGPWWCDGYGVEFNFLGLPKPVISAATNGSSGGARRFRVTYRVEAAGLDRPTRGVGRSEYYNYPATYESNPNGQPTFTPGAGVTLSTPGVGIGYVELSNYINGTLTIDSPSVAQTPTLAGMIWEVAVYATPIGNVNGPYLYYDRVTITPPASATTTGFVASTGRETGLILSWDEGGAPGNQIFINDNSPCPTDMAVFSDGLHTVADAGGSGPAGALPVPGILFGATEKKLYWSRLGYPWYWPTANTLPIPEVQSIVNNGATTYVGTPTGWYVITGSDDQGLTASGPFGPDGVARGAGRSALLTPYGVMFFGKRGLCLFNGSGTTCVHEIIQHPASLWGTAPVSLWPSCFTTSGYSLPCAWAVYNDGIYMADMGGTSSIIASLDNWPRVDVSYSNRDANRIGVGPVVLATGPDQALGISENFVTTPALLAIACRATGALGSAPTLWDPRRALGTDAVSNVNEFMYAEARTQQIDLGVPGRRKKLKKVRVRGTGSFSITFVVGRGVTQVATHTITTDGEHWLPSTFDWIDWVQVTITSGTASAGTGGTLQLEGIEILGVVYAAP